VGVVAGCWALLLLLLLLLLLVAQSVLASAQVRQVLGGERSPTGVSVPASTRHKSC
jgi:hypothetical protein